MTTGTSHRETLGPWKGRAFLSLGSALYLGPAGDTTPHSHHALQLCVGLEDSFRLREGTGPWREYDAAIIPADVPHQLDGEWTDLLLFYLEPEGAETRTWYCKSRSEIQTLDPVAASAIRASVRKLVDSPSDEGGVWELYAKLLPDEDVGSRTRTSLDARIAKSVRLLRDSQAARKSLHDLAVHAGLSASRFRHLFRREIGMSAQSYIVWLRIYEACTALARGATLSEAAFRSGFSDAAHFTRTFRRTFDLAPSQLAARLTVMKSPGSDGSYST